MDAAWEVEKSIAEQGTIREYRQLVDCHNTLEQLQARLEQLQARLEQLRKTQQETREQWEQRKAYAAGIAMKVGNVLAATAFTLAMKSAERGMGKVVGEGLTDVYHNYGAGAVYRVYGANAPSYKPGMNTSQLYEECWEMVDVLRQQVAELEQLTEQITNPPRRGWLGYGGFSTKRRRRRKTGKKKRKSRRSRRQ